MHDENEELKPFENISEVVEALKEANKHIENIEIERKLITIKNHEVLKDNLLSCSEEERDILIEAFFSSTRDDEHWEDIIQRGFLGYFCEANDEPNAKKAIESCSDPRSQDGRIQKYKKYFGEYKGKIAETIDQKITEEERETLEQNFKINKTYKFKEALDLGLLKVAEAWIANIEITRKYSNLEGEKLDNFINDRKRELRKEREKREETK
ncbi:MAG: hypothetical protein PF572_04335 [Patescibacteria group bacterium]|jgi:hypothetical protein|nr:hypothetical protein [Patescibacteria group bacterium]